MIPLELHLDADASPIATPGGLADHGQVSDVALHANGTANGRAVVAVAIVLPDGSKVIGETTYDLWRMAARALAASPIAQAQPPLP